MWTRVPEIDFRPTLPTLLHQAATVHGDDDFLVMPGRRLSFREAEQRSADLGRRLVAAGVGKGTRVGISLPTGFDWVTAWLAAARIGAMPMLFPATYRALELRRALRFSDAALLLSTRDMLGKDHQALLEEAIPSLSSHRSGPLADTDLPYLRSVWVVADGGDRWIASDEPDGDPRAVDAGLFDAIEEEVSPADPIAVVYTSGSSGDPKAVVHTHGAAIRKMLPEVEAFLTASVPGRHYCAMPFFWVGGPQELLGALISGSTIVTQARFDVDEALDLLENERCTTIMGWPGLLDAVTSHPTAAQRDLSSLVLSTRAAATSSRGDRPFYGMTETFGINANKDWFEHRIIDPETGEVVPDGVEGELILRGFGLMAGMYKREREEVFDADGWYHTGDRAYIENGHVWFRGRYSAMIKTRGANVSPLEVESVLTSLPGVDEGFVLGIPDDEIGEAVAAVVVAESGSSLDTDDLAAQLIRAVSAYKVPKRWLVLETEQIPRLPSGKPDKITMQAMFAEVDRPGG